MIDYTQERTPDERPLQSIDVDMSRSIKQSNRLIEANYYLSEVEQKFILFAISQLTKDADNFSRLSFRVADVLKALNLGEKHHSYLKDMCLQLMSRVLVLRHGKSLDNWYMTHWVQSIRYNSEESTIEIGFDERLKPDLLKLRQAYVTSPAELCLTFKGKYTARFYLLISQYEKIGERILSIDDLIERFCLSKAYKNRFSKIRELVEYCLNQILKKSDIEFQFEFTKKGHKINALRVFNIRKKAVESAPASAATQTKKSDELETVNTNELYRELLAFGVVNSVTRNILENFDAMQIKRNIDYVKRHSTSTIKNKAGFLLAAIADDYAAAEEAMKRIQKEEEERYKQKIKERIEAAEVMQRLAQGAQERELQQQELNENTKAKLKELIEKMKKPLDNDENLL